MSSASVQTEAKPTKQRRFAPLDRSRPNLSEAPRLRGIVFDVDGTLCLPQNYMFREMRAALNIPKSTDILDHITSLSAEPDQSDDSSPRSRAQEAIKQIERDAMSSQQPQPGLNELLTYLASRGLRLALCTRNFELPVKHLLEKFVDEEARSRFYPLITRETDGVLPKPSPQGVWACVEAWQRVGREEGGGAEVKATAEVEDTEAVSEEEKVRLCEGVIMLGDSVDDIEAGARAGAATVLLVNEENEHLMEASEWPKRVDLGIRRLDGLIEVLEEGFCGR